MDDGGGGGGGGGIHFKREAAFRTSIFKCLPLPKTTPKHTHTDEIKDLFTVKVFPLERE